MKKTTRAAAALIALCLCALSLFACAPQPTPIEGADAIRTAILESLPTQENLAILFTPVWGDDTTGDTYLVRKGDDACRVTVARKDGGSCVLTLVDRTLYLSSKTPAAAEGEEPTERRLSLSLSDEEAAALVADYTTMPFLAPSLADLILSGTERAYRLPDGKRQFISENPDVTLLSEHTGALFYGEAPRELFAVTDATGRLVYLRVTGEATRTTPETVPLYLEYAVSYESVSLSAPEDADAYVPATREEILPLLPVWY